VNLGAARAKKDVYAEKPLTLTIDEGRRLVNAVQKSGIVLQTGTQQRSSAAIPAWPANSCATVESESCRPRMSGCRLVCAKGPFATVSRRRPNLNWDFWLGQAPKVDYVRERCHRTFRFWYDYSGGTMTDWGAHHNDIAYWAIGLLAPEKVESRVLTQPIPGGYDTFSEYEVNYTYANGIQLNIRTTRDESFSGAKLKEDGQRNGIRFEGTEGWIWVNRDGISASDPELLKTPLPENAVRLYSSSNHMGKLLRLRELAEAADL
jgi:predicted dehydrogenase